jgi:hypothetical protein
LAGLAVRPLARRRARARAGRPVPRVTAADRGRVRRGAPVLLEGAGPDAHRGVRKRAPPSSPRSSRSPSETPDASGPSRRSPGPPGANPTPDVRTTSRGPASAPPPAGSWP